MAHTDPIADFLTQIRNGLKAKKEKVIIPASKLKIEIARIMKEEGYIHDYQVVPREGKSGEVVINLKYSSSQERVVNGLKRISKPGLRVYAGKNEIPVLLGGMGTVVVSTSQGVMTGKEAKKVGVGGEVVCYIW
ncbi:MAG: small subunit ribosomal protein [Candidatus Atribacteria bacterium]|nr:small subunit ribosomal protein [Candidatus Atribacteria bacterium]